MIVGVNRFQEEEEEPPGDILRIDPDLERAQVERVRALRARRDPGRLEGLAGRPRGPRPAPARTWCRRSSTRSWPGPRWARSRAGCAGSSASTGRRSSCERRAEALPLPAARRRRRSRSPSCCPPPGSRSRPTSTPARRASWGRATRAGSSASRWRSALLAGLALALRRWPGSGLVRGLRETVPLPRLHPHLHEPPRHDRLREPPRRAPLAGRPSTA